MGFGLVVLARASGLFLRGRLLLLIPLNTYLIGQVESEVRRWCRMEVGGRWPIGVGGCARLTRAGGRAAADVSRRRLDAASFPKRMCLDWMDLCIAAWQHHGMAP